MIEKKLAPTVVIGVPSYSEKFNGNGKTGGGISLQWAEMFHGIQTPLGSIVSRYAILDKVVDVARNDIVEHALSVGAEWLFFVADDVFVPSDAIIKMMSHGKEIVTGVYFTKEYPSNPYIWRGLDGYYTDWKAGEFFEIDMAGCDCLLVHTSVFKKIGYPYFSRDWTWFRDKFGNAVAPNAGNTEDFYFYAKAKEAGYKIWCDSSVLCTHQDRKTGKKYGLLPGMPMYQKKIELETSDNGLVALIGEPKIQVENKGKHVLIEGDERKHPDMRCNLKSIPVNDQTYDVVNVTNVLERFPASETVECLNEWIRILKVGGKLILNITNLEAAFKEILNGNNDKDMWGLIYGQEPTLFNNGFTPAIVKAMLESSAQLDNVKVERQIGTNLIAIAEKIKHHEPMVLHEKFQGKYCEQTIGANDEIQE